MRDSAGTEATLDEIAVAQARQRGARPWVSNLVCSLTLDHVLDEERLQRAVVAVSASTARLRSWLDLTHSSPASWIATDAITVELRDGASEPTGHVVTADLDAMALEDFPAAGHPWARVVAHVMNEHGLRLSLVIHPAVATASSAARVLHAIADQYVRSDDSVSIPVSEARHADPHHSAPFCDQEVVDYPLDPQVQEERWLSDFSAVSPTSGSDWMFDPAHEASPRVPAPASRRLPPAPEDELERQLVAGLRAVARSLDVSLGMVLLAAHARAVGTSVGDPRVAIAVEAAALTASDQGMASATTRLLAVDVDAGSWSGLLQRVNEAWTASRRRTWPVPLGLLTLSRDDVPSATFACWQQSHNRAAGSSEATVFQPSHGEVRADFWIADDESAIAMQISATGSISIAQLTECRRAHLALLAAMSAAVDLDDVDTLTAEHRGILLEQWNGPARPYPLTRCVHELITAQAQSTPDAIAVEDASRSLTYRDLVTTADRWAHSLAARGAGSGTVIGVCMSRSLEMVIGFLAILKTGAAYLPLDPGHPTQRLTYMLSDVAAPMVLTDDRTRDRIPAGLWSLMTVRELDQLDPSTDVEVPDAPCRPEDLMYVIYTSGSTGPPKGVEVPHAGVVNYLAWCAEAYARDSSGGAPVFSSVAFDAVVPNLYTPLIMGQRVHLLPEDISPVELADELVRQGPYAFIKLTPGHLRLLAECLAPEQARSLTGMLAVGADAFPAQTLRQWRLKDLDTPVLNEYGPTEASVGNCVYFVDDAGASDLIPIGRAIPNTTMYVLDDKMRLLPAGVRGELYIGGRCVVRGYRNRPEQSQERFVPDPFSDAAGARMYRTGDIGRWLPGGVLEFLGRIDDQVKIRGYRVEPAEVEEAMCQHPDVAAAVVRVLGDSRETYHLAGYYVPRANDQLPAESLRQFLLTKLPDYLIPTFLISIESIPLNRNGKADRAALPPPRRRTTRGQANADRPAAEVAAVVRASSIAADPSGRHGFGEPRHRVQLAARLAEVIGLEPARIQSIVWQARSLDDVIDGLSRQLALK